MSSFPSAALRGWLQVADKFYNIEGLLAVPFEKMKCWELVVEVYRRAGLVIPCYSRDDETCASWSAFNRNKIDWLNIEDPEPLAIVAMSMDSKYPKYVQHFGVCLDDGLFIHTLKKTNAMVTNLEHRYFAPKIRGFYRWNGSL